MTSILKPSWISAVMLSLGLAPGLASAEAKWPTKPIRVIVPFGPGSSPDVVARIVTDQASKSLGQPIVVENRLGASGNIGTQAIARAAPDGYTFGVSITGPMVNNTVLMKDLPYDPFTELAPLTLAVHQPNVIVVPKQSGITKVEELLKLLKDKPDQLNFPSPGAGTVSHLSVELMLQRVGSSAVHAPYPSSPAAMTSLVSGDTQFAALPPIAVMPLVNDGRLTALAVTSSQRSATLPSIPTLAEVGVEGIEGSAWIGFVINAKVPADIQKKISDSLRAALKNPDVVQKLQTQFMDPVGDSPEAFKTYMDEELKRWKPIITKLGIQQ